MSCTKMTAADAKSGRNRSRKHVAIASPPVADDLVETQSIPNFSEAEKLRVQQNIGKPLFYYPEFFSDCDELSTPT